jgi:hypothetical protein
MLFQDNRVKGRDSERLQQELRAMQGWQILTALNGRLGEATLPVPLTSTIFEDS